MTQSEPQVFQWRVFRWTMAFPIACMVGMLIQNASLLPLKADYQAFACLVMPLVVGLIIPKWKTLACLVFDLGLVFLSYQLNVFDEFPVVKDGRHILASILQVAAAPLLAGTLAVFVWECYLRFRQKAT